MVPRNTGDHGHGRLRVEAGGSGRGRVGGGFRDGSGDCGGGLRADGLRVRVGGLGLRVGGLGRWVGGPGLCVGGLRLRDGGLGFRDGLGRCGRVHGADAGGGLGFRVGGLGFRVAGLGFRVAGLGLRDGLGRYGRVHAAHGADAGDGPGGLRRLSGGPYGGEHTRRGNRALPDGGRGRGLRLGEGLRRTITRRGGSGLDRSGRRRRWPRITVVLRLGLRNRLLLNCLQLIWRLQSWPERRWRLRGQCGHRFLRADVRCGRLRITEQLTPLDGRTYAQRQQGDPADGNRQVDEHQLAGDHTGDEQTDRHDNEKRTEADHSRSPSRPCRPLLIPTGARDA